MPPSQAPAAAPAAVLQAFERQARWCQQPSPFSAAVLQRSQQWLQAHADALQHLCALAPDPLAGAVPLRWLGALHLLALEGLQPWAGLWPSTRAQGGAPGAGTAPDALPAALDEAIDQAWHTQRPALQAALQSPPQTNEVQRSAALLPGLLHIATHTRLPLELLEIGASAGLNLWCDRYRHDHGCWAWPQGRAALVLRSDWQGPPPPQAAPLHIARRAGCDANPIALDDPQQARRLVSYIWADQADRLRRLQQAQEVAAPCMAQAGLRVQQLGAAAFLRQQLAQRRAGQATVLMHSVVWQYIAPAEQADIEAQMQAAGQTANERSPLAWLRFEPPQPDQGMELRCRIWPGGEDLLLANCHPHGSRIEWRA